MARIGSPGKSLTKAKAQIVIPNSVGISSAILLRRNLSMVERGRRAWRRPRSADGLFGLVDAVEAMDAERIHHVARDVLANRRINLAMREQERGRLLLEDHLR